MHWRDGWTFLKRNLKSFISIRRGLMTCSILSHIVAMGIGVSLAFSTKDCNKKWEFVDQCAMESSLTKNQRRYLNTLIISLKMHNSRIHLMCMWNIRRSHSGMLIVKSKQPKHAASFGFIRTVLEREFWRENYSHENEKSPSQMKSLS